jgi:hypothetical protein
MFRFLCALSLAVGLAAFQSGCRKRQLSAPVPAPPAQAPADTAPALTPTPAGPPSLTPPVVSPPPPQSPPQQEDLNQKNKAAQPPPAAQPQPGPPPVQTPPRRASRRTEQPSTSPRLGDILTPEQERQYNSAIDQSLTRAQTSLGAIGNRQLNKEQKTLVAQIEGFIQQAQTRRKSSLSAARSLAERAEVLARDLAGSMR